MKSDRDKSRFISRKIQLLKEFGVSVSPHMIKHIESLYPNEILVENYTRKLILSKLEANEN